MGPCQRPPLRFGAGHGGDMGCEKSQRIGWPSVVEIPETLRELRVALVHDYLNQRGGAENVVEIFAEMFPGAPLFTSVYDADAMSPSWGRLDVRTTFLQRLSPRLRFAKALLPLYPAAFETLDLSGFDLVLSSTTAFAKGVVTRPHTCHVCYCNNPTRLFWMYHDYLQYERLCAGGPNAPAARRLADARLGFLAAQRPDYFIAGSYNAGAPNRQILPARQPGAATAHRRGQFLPCRRCWELFPCCFPAAAL